MTTQAFQHRGTPSIVHNGRKSSQEEAKDSKYLVALLSFEVLSKHRQYIDS